jgi:transcriptional regulator of acetoin/glycerol metabolism
MPDVPPVSVAAKLSPRRNGVAPDAMAKLLAKRWPGNVRELRNVLERARLFADDGIVRADCLPDEPAAVVPTTDPATSPATDRAASPATDPATSPATLHGRAVGPGRVSAGDAELAALAPRFTGTRRELAAHLGVSERTLYRRLKALGLA